MRFPRIRLDLRLFAPPLVLGFGPGRRFAPGEGASEARTVADPGLKTFFEQSKDPMVLLNPDLTIAVANPAASRFLGVPARQLRGTPVLEVSLLARLLTAASIPQRIKAENSPVTDEISVTDAEGQAIQAQLEAVTLEDGRCLLHFHNTTAVLRAKAALRQAEQLHQAAFEALPGVAWMMALPEERLLEVSPAVERLFGYQPAVFLQRPELWSEIVHPAERERVHAEFRSGIATGRPFDIEFTGIHRDHHDLPHLVNRVVPVRDENGWVDRCEGLIEDLGRVRRAEAGLRSAEANLRYIMESVSSGILVVTPSDDGPRVTLCNRLLAHMLKLDAPIRSGTPLSETPREVQRLVFGDREDPAPEHTLLSEETREEINELQEPLRVLRRFAGPLRDQYGAVVGRIVTVEDITATWVMQRRLTHAQKMESMGRLAGGVAHDFNNLLGTILGFGSLLYEQSTPDDPRRPSLEQIVHAADRASRLTGALLAFSRSARFERLPVPLNRVIEDSYQIMRTALDPSIGIVLTLEPELPNLIGDALLLQQVVVNLVQEVRERLQGGGTLHLVTRMIEQPQPAEQEGLEPGAQHMVALEVHAVGRPGDGAASAPPPIVAAADRAGLAMTIVEDIVRAHGGYLVTQPAAGAALFQVAFPVDIKEDAPLLEPVVAAAHGHETVMVVDDEPGLRALAKQGLMSCGFDVMTTESGEQALDILRKGAPHVDIVLLDLTLPGISGEKVLRSIRSFMPALPVIIASGYATVENQSSWVAAGAMGFVAKPYRIQSVAAKLRETLDRVQGRTT